MKKLFSIMLITIICLSCQNNGEKTELSKEDYEHVVIEYLSQDATLSEEVPAEGYHSPKEAVMHTFEVLAPQGEFDINEGEEWKYDCQLEEPVLVHNFRGSNTENYINDLYYVIYGTHPEYGNIGGVLYEYNDFSDANEGPVEVHSIGKQDIDSGCTYRNISQIEADQYFAERLDTNSMSSPSAVFLDKEYYESQMNFQWYVEVSNNRGGHEEYLMESAILRERNVRGSAKDVKIVKIKENLNVLEAIELMKDSINSGSRGNSPKLRILSSDDFEPVP